MRMSIEAARGLQTALERIDQANEMLRQASFDAECIEAAMHYQAVKAEAGPAFAEAARQFELPDDLAPAEAEAEPTAPAPVPDEADPPPADDPAGQDVTEPEPPADETAPEGS